MVNFKASNEMQGATTKHRHSHVKTKTTKTTTKTTYRHYARQMALLYLIYAFVRRYPLEEVLSQVSDVHRSIVRRTASTSDIRWPRERTNKGGEGGEEEKHEIRKRGTKKIRKANFDSSRSTFGPRKVTRIFSRLSHKVWRKRTKSQRCTVREDLWMK